MMKCICEIFNVRSDVSHKRKGESERLEGRNQSHHRIFDKN